MARESRDAFAVWITGLPASGKSTFTAALKRQLEQRGLEFEVLESDDLRKKLAAHPAYDQASRDAFYRQIAYIGALLTQHGISVIFDATANLRAYRDRARELIPRFVEVFIDVPLETCIARDPKGIYHGAREGSLTAVPGIQIEYEPPLSPEFVVHGDKETPDAAASRLIAKLEALGYSKD